MSKFYFFYSADEKRLVDAGQIHDFDVFTYLLLIAYIVSGVFYTVLSFKYLKKHKALINANFSYDEKINLQWLNYFIWSLGAIFFSAIIVITTRDLYGIIYPFNPDIIFYSMLIFAVVLLGYFESLKN